MTALKRVCLIGFGEVGQTLASDLQAAGVAQLTAYDTLFKDTGSVPSRAAKERGVRIAEDANEAASNADLIVSAVTAGQDIEAARSLNHGIKPSAFFLDVNSVSPGIKQQAAQITEAAGARYVEAAIMSPIAPKRIASPMLLGGAHATTFLPLGQALGFTGAKVFSDQLGRASAAKMCRSVMIKGIEALLAESLLTARHYGVESTVIESLQNLVPAESWRSLSRYMISRSLIHGRRRAEEMREVAQTVAEAGIEPHMSTAAALRQEWAAGFAASASVEELEAMLDSVLSQSEKSQC